VQTVKGASDAAKRVFKLNAGYVTSIANSAKPNAIIVFYDYKEYR